MNKKTISSIVAACIGVIVLIFLLLSGIGHNDDQNWQVIQSVRGNVTIRDTPGYYLKWFATVWTYPRYVDKSWNDEIDMGDKATESIRTTFNDGGTAQISTYVRYATPTDADQRRKFHQQFSGNIENATIAVKSHQTNCIKATGPLMSASENQSARKAEFTQIIWNQMTDGLYKMSRKEIQISRDYDPTDPNGKLDMGMETRITTEIIADKDGNPEIAKQSPLDEYGISVFQFSVTAIEYDEETLKQFAAKKQSFLAAEQSKADREKEKQERLNIIEKGLREVAEAEAAANVLKETAVIAAQLKAEVAIQEKLEAETKAEMALSVAEIEKQEAQIKLETAGIDAQAIVELAKAEQEKIRLAGAITELEQFKIDAQVQMAEEVSKNLAQIRVPAFIMNSGSNNGTTNNTPQIAAEDSVMKMMFNLMLMDKTGILNKTDIENSVVKRIMDRSANAVPIADDS